MVIMIIIINFRRSGSSNSKEVFITRLYPSHISIIRACPVATALLGF